MCQESSLVKEAYRLSELNLDSTVRLAIASDQRSIQFAGLCVVAVGLFFSLLSIEGNSDFVIPTLLIVISASLSIISARSRRVYVPGMYFSSLEDDITADRPYCETLAELGDFNDSSVRHNKEVLRANSVLFNAACGFALLGLVIGLIPFVP